jgi:RNA polymerase sigma factor (sigma-70 family)
MKADLHVKPPFEAVVARHGAMVLRVVRAVVGHTDADDAWSDTFLAALNAYPRLPADANIEAWLVTIAHRKAIDITRAASRRAIPVADTPDSPARERADSHDLDLDAAVGALPPKQRQAVAYHYLAGLPYAEVAVILDSSVTAARRAAADGIATLRRTYPISDTARNNP